MLKKPRKPRASELSVVKEEAAMHGLTAPESIPKGERYISPNEVGRILNVTGEAVKQWIYHRRLPAVKMSNGYWKVKVADLENFLKARQSMSQRRIMIVGQSAAVTKEMVKGVEDMGHEPVVAYNHSDAMLKAVDLLPALFVIDLAANPDEAWSLLERIRKHRELRRMAVLLISNGNLQEKDNTRALEMGVQGLLTRPITSKLLQDEIAKILTRVM